MAKITQLTQHSWLIRNNTNLDYTGLLFLQNQKYIFMSPTKRFEFDDMDAVAKKFGKLKEDTKSAPSEKSAINGFPVKHENFALVSEDPPLYTKGFGKTEYLAGYCGIKYDKGWTLALCPKYATCKEYGYCGPFRNRLEALNHISALNNRLADDTTQ